MTYEKWKGDMSSRGTLDGADDRILFVVGLCLEVLVAVVLVMVLVKIG